jgi:hypothetical protein
LGLDHLLGVHGHEVTKVEAGRCCERLMQGNSGEYDGECPLHHYASLYGVNELRGIAVARVEVTTGVDYTDQWLRQVRIG